jgi:cobalt/nickel transport system permease protein
MASRGYDPRWISQARPIASSAGALFVRSYERGERVHAAMLARGYTGEMPVPSTVPVGASQWARVIVLVAAFAGTAIVALVVV